MKLRMCFPAVVGLILSLFMHAASAELVVVVSKQNPVETLRLSDIRDIYLGRMDRFPNGERAVPIDQSESASAYGEFYREYHGRSPAEIKAHWSRLIFTGRGQPPRAVRDGASMVDAVADNPHAIGYVDSGIVDDRLRVIRIE